MTQVLMSAWTELTNGINSSASLLNVRTHHERYVDAATKSCFLDDPGREVIDTSEPAIAHIDTLLTSFACDQQIHESFAALLDTAWRTSELLHALEQRATGFASEQERAVALRDAHATARRRLATALDGVGHDQPRSVRAFAEVSRPASAVVSLKALVGDACACVVLHERDRAVSAGPYGL